MTRTLVIGDVHGCAEELEALLGACQHDASDRVVLVGDLLRKGPDAAGVLEIFRRVGAESTCGNHDMHLLRWRQAIDAGTEPRRIDPDSEGFITEMSEADWALLRALPLVIRLPEHGAAVVHAGAVPGIPLEQQDPEVLLNVRTIRPDGSPSKGHADGPLWGELWPGPEFLLFGHHARAGLQQHPHAIGLDTGCVYGGALTACVLPDKRIVSVKAKRMYVRPG
ncbi:MAG: metallophosphoesterase [Myxococcales bacterium]|nr:metallophosphoesterase [Myxococcales bacterium]